jgi:hypothetical protein
MTALLRFYPPAWRDRYGEEMEALLAQTGAGPRWRLDLARGALDAWLHPARPSAVPIVAALLGGGSWTVVATAVIAQPAPPDWPGYLMDTLPLAIVSVACQLVAALACLLRLGDVSDRQVRLTAGLLLVGYLAWLLLLVATLAGAAGGPPLGAAQTVALLGTIAVGAILTRRGDQPIGYLVLVAPVALLVPTTVAWLGFGAAWTAIGLAMWLDRERRAAPPAGTAPG